MEKFGIFLFGEDIFKREIVTHKENSYLMTFAVFLQVMSLVNCFFLKCFRFKNDLTAH